MQMSVRKMESCPSRPARGAWIEIVPLGNQHILRAGRAPHGARGLKYILLAVGIVKVGVAPRTGRVD